MRPYDGPTAVTYATSTQVFPVYTGMDRLPNRFQSGYSRVPRIHGDGPDPEFEQPDFEECSLYTRGWTERVNRESWRVNVFPVYTGMNHGICPTVPVTNRVPRVYGNYPGQCTAINPGGWCSPRCTGKIPWISFHKV